MITDAELPPARRKKAQQLGARVARAAAAHYGVLTTTDLLALGLSSSAISRWQQAGRLFAVYRGVYAVGRRDLPPRGAWHAALEALGAATWLSHQASVEVWGWQPPISHPIHVTTTRRGLRSRKGLVIHCVATPPALTTRWGLRVTTTAATLADMAAAVRDDRALIRLCSQAAYAGHYDRDRLLDQVAQGRPGSARLRRVLATLDVGGGHTRSELEDALRALIVRHGILAPDFNAPLGPFLADALWPDHALVVELDSRLAHDSEPAYFTDREKDLVYAEAGLECLRLTWRQVVGQESRIARLLRSRVGAAELPPARRDKPPSGAAQAM